MQQRPFGSTGLTVSEVGFGCARLGGVFEGDTKSDVLKTLRAAFDQGITFFDTADMYTQGESEKLLGAAFRKDRDKVVIASKAGFCLPAQKKVIGKIKPLLGPLIRRAGIKRENIPSGLKGSITQDFSPRYLTTALERSLRRLKTDYLDLYQLHSPPTWVLERGEFIAPLEKLKEQGKIRFYGVSCETTQDAIVCLGYPELSSLQVRLSLLEQSTLTEVLPRASARGIALVARECFAGGMLVKPFDASMQADASPDEQLPHDIVAYRELAERFGRPLAELAVRFVLHLEGVSVSLVGMRTQGHVADTLHYIAARPLLHHEMLALCNPGTAAAGVGGVPV